MYAILVPETRPTKRVPKTSTYYTTKLFIFWSLIASLIHVSCLLQRIIKFCLVSRFSIQSVLCPANIHSPLNLCRSGKTLAKKNMGKIPPIHINIRGDTFIITLGLASCYIVKVSNGSKVMPRNRILIPQIVNWMKSIFHNDKDMMFRFASLFWHPHFLFLGNRTQSASSNPCIEHQYPYQGKLKKQYAVLWAVSLYPIPCMRGVVHWRSSKLICFLIRVNEDIAWIVFGKQELSFNN